MPTPSKYPTELLQSAAAFDPSIIDKMRRWQGFYQPGGREVQQLDRLIVEAQGGATARLPEAVHFAAAQGDESAINTLQAETLRRDQLLGELIGELDPAKFERFRAQQRAAAAGALESQLLKPTGPVAGALGARRQLLDALNTRR
jgi:hypothetical protein